MEELSKYIKGEQTVVNRSSIHFADYNPRVLGSEEHKSLKRGIKKFGLLGSIIVNKQTGMTVVSGHQRVTVTDELQKYNPETGENDYSLRVDVIDVDPKTEKELNILLNNPNAQGKWDFEKLAQLIGDIDYKDAGLTEADLNMIGVDFTLETEGEKDLADELGEVLAPITEERERTKAEQAALKEYIKNNQEEAKEAQEADWNDKVQHMKDVKQQVKEAAQEKAENMDAYLMLSFDTFSAKAAFCERFGYDKYDKFIKGEIFSDQVERID